MIMARVNSLVLLAAAKQDDNFLVLLPTHAVLQVGEETLHPLHLREEKRKRLSTPSALLLFTARATVLVGVGTLLIILHVFLGI